MLSLVTCLRPECDAKSTCGVRKLPSKSQIKQKAKEEQKSQINEISQLTIVAKSSNLRIIEKFYGKCKRIKHKLKGLTSLKIGKPSEEQKPNAALLLDSELVSENRCRKAELHKKAQGIDSQQNKMNKPDQKMEFSKDKAEVEVDDAGKDLIIFKEKIEVVNNEPEGDKDEENAIEVGENIQISGSTDTVQESSEDSGVEDSFQESGEDSGVEDSGQEDSIELQPTWFEKQRAILLDEGSGIVFDKKELDLQDQDVKDKANDLKKIMPKIEMKELVEMSAFVKKNQDRLIQLVKDKELNGLYLRREVSELPLSLLITPDGKFIWATKAKAAPDVKPMGDQFKQLYRAFDHKNVQSYVIGTITLRPDSENAKANKVVAYSEMRAGKALKGLENVAQVIHSMIYQSKGDKLIEKVLIVMKDYKNGDLQKIIEGGGLTKEKKEDVVNGTVNGIIGIHEQDWLHRDIKPGNIFFDENMKAHLGDFGLAHHISKPAPGGLIRYYHPHFYNNPSLIREKQQDMFSLGLTLAQMELGLSVLPWEERMSRLLSDDKQGIFNVLEQGLKDLYDKFPQVTPTQKFIKILLNPQIDKIPVGKEAKKIWEECKTSRP